MLHGPMPSPLHNTMSTPDTVWSDAELQAHIDAHLPHWRVEAGQLQRTYRTSGWKATMMVVSTIGHLAEAAWHHPELDVSYAQVQVRLVTHSAGGLTAKDITLAERIEQVVHWQPAHETGSPLEGPPAGAAYIRYDA